MLRELQHPIETLRTVPIQCIGTVVPLGAAAIGAALAIESDNAPLLVHALAWGTVALNAGIAAGVATIGKRNIELRNHLESILTNIGFNERVMMPTTIRWCSRQAARIACENSGYLEEYSALYKQNPEAQHTWLPHI